MTNRPLPDLSTLVVNPAGRYRLLDAIDKTGGLASAMEPDVIYSLADRPCSSCVSGGREHPGVSVALVKRAVDGPSGPLRLHALCEEHADEWEQKL